jgi:tetratricopeptide (TPR) repeat protein
MPRYQEYAVNGRQAAVEETQSGSISRAAKGKKRKPAPVGWKSETWIKEAASGALLVGLLMLTLGYNLITNTTHLKSLFPLLWSSFTRLPNNGNVVSYGVLGMLGLAWLVISLLWCLAAAQNGERFWKKLAIVMGGSLLIGLVFWIWHSGQLVALENIRATTIDELIQQVDNVGGMLTTYYIFVFILLLAAGYFLRSELVSRHSSESTLAVLAGAGLALTILILAYVTNLRIIHADMAFKMAEPFNRSTQWGIAAYIYRHANTLAPDEDHYYLFLGRAYLEQAKETSDSEEVDALILQAEQDLKVAQRINPLNTDHTANLARLYSAWAGQAETSEERNRRAQAADQYYSVAVKLSPQNSTLWGEWALTIAEFLNQPDLAFEKIQHALALDPKYTFTQGLAGDYYSRIARAATDEAEKAAAYQKAIEHYTEAIAVAKSTEVENEIAYLVARGNIYIETGRHAEAIPSMEAAVALAAGSGDVYRIEESLARLYLRTGDLQTAMQYAQSALQKAPEEAVERIEQLIAEIQSTP